MLSNTVWYFCAVFYYSVKHILAIRLLRWLVDITAVSSNNHVYFSFEKSGYILTNMYSILRHSVSQNCCSVFSEKLYG